MALKRPREPTKWPAAAAAAQDSNALRAANQSAVVDSNPTHETTMRPRQGQPRRHRRPRNDPTRCRRRTVDRRPWERLKGRAEGRRPTCVAFEQSVLPARATIVESGNEVDCYWMRSDTSAALISFPWQPYQQLQQLAHAHYRLALLFSLTRVHPSELLFRIIWTTAARLFCVRGHCIRSSVIATCCRGTNMF